MSADLSMLQKIRKQIESVEKTKKTPTESGSLTNSDSDKDDSVSGPAPVAAATENKPVKNQWPKWTFPSLPSNIAVSSIHNQYLLIKFTLF